MTTTAIVGAIRWAAWYSDLPTQPAAQTARALSPIAHRGRAPKHAVVTKGRISWLNGSATAVQAAIDAEILAAEAGGLKYWAFFQYADAANGYLYPSLDHSMMAANKAYLASPHKSRLKHCLIAQGDQMGTTGNSAAAVSYLVNALLDPQYLTIGANRPVLYIYGLAYGITSRWAGSTANFKSMLDAVRAGVIAGGRGDPYVVSMDGTATANAVAVGCDAVSAYISPLPTGCPAPYSALHAAAQSYWTQLATAAVAAGIKCVPIAMTGWNTAPRRQRPVSWKVNVGAGGYMPFIGSGSMVTLPTNTELATHFQAAVNFASGNAACDSKLVLAYAWDECDEGGWLMPTLGDPSGSRLAAIAPIIT